MGGDGCSSNIIQFSRTALVSVSAVVFSLGPVGTVKAVVQAVGATEDATVDAAMEDVVVATVEDALKLCVLQPSHLGSVDNFS